MSLDQSKQSDFPNGKISPAVLFPLIPNGHVLVKFCKCHKSGSILPHEAKALLQLFCLQPITFGLRQNSSSSYFASSGKIKIHDFTLADQDWIGLVIFKNLQIRTGSDSILSDQDWTGTENFHSPLISAKQWCHS